MSREVYIGIDPGGDGYFAKFGEHCGYDFISLADHSFAEVDEWVKEVTRQNDRIFAVCEDVHAVFGSSAKGTFMFGMSKGMIIGLLIANRIPYSLVAPKEWQKEMWINADKVYKTGKKIDTKKTSENCALRLAFDLDFRRTPKCTKNHDGKIDAFLITEYARRKNL